MTVPTPPISQARLSKCSCWLSTLLCCFFHLTQPLVLSLGQQRPVPLWHLCPVCLVTTVTSKGYGPQKGDEERKGTGLSLRAHRSLVGAIALRRGHQSSPGQQGTTSPPAASTGDVGCQYKPAQLTPLCAASARAQLEVGPSKLGEEDKPAASTLCSCSRPVPTWRGETTERHCSPKGGLRRTLGHHSSHEARALWVARDRAEEEAELSPDHQWARGCVWLHVPLVTTTGL